VSTDAIHRNNKGAIAASFNLLLVFESHLDGAEYAGL